MKERKANTTNIGKTTFFEISKILGYNVITSNIIETRERKHFTKYVQYEISDNFINFKNLNAYKTASRQLWEFVQNVYADRMDVFVMEYPLDGLPVVRIYFVTDKDISDIIGNRFKF